MVTFTPTPVLLTFTPNINAYCRFGPDLAFDSLALAMSGQSYPMDGRNSDGTWYRIMVTPDMGCWVSAGVGTTSADSSRLRVLMAVPTYTATPAICETFLDAGICELNNPPCQWIVSLVGVPGACVKK